MNIGPLRITWRKNEKEKPVINLKETPGDPAMNGAEMIETLVDGFQHIRERTEEQLVYFGRVFSVVLYIEHKLEQILVKYDPRIEKKMLGEKISIYKNFLSELKRMESSHPIDFGFQFDIYEKSKQALTELNKIRRKYAHSVGFEYIKKDSIRSITNFNKTERIDLWRTVPETLQDDLFVIGQLYIFAFSFSHGTTELIDAQKSNKAEQATPNGAPVL